MLLTHEVLLMDLDEQTAKTGGGTNPTPTDTGILSMSTLQDHPVVFVFVQAALPFPVSGTAYANVPSFPSVNSKQKCSALRRGIKIALTGPSQRRSFLVLLSDQK